MNMSATPIDRYRPAAIALLEAAEALIAEKGIDGTSSREVARRAGQKNHSAVNYNFGSFEGLVEALIDYRVAPINRAREEALAALLQRAETPALADLVALMVEPLAAQLLAPGGDSRYLNLLTQLLSRDQWRQTFMRNRARSGALQQIAALVNQHLDERLPVAIRDERQRVLGRHIVEVVAEWDARMRSGEIPRDETSLAWRTQDLINCSVAGLLAPAPANCEYPT